MHASYIFLMDINDDEVTPQDIVLDWEDYYASRYCDENNWYAVETVILNDKEYHGEDFRLADNTRTIEDVFDMAAQIAAYDLHLFGASTLHIPGMTKEDEGQKKINSMNHEEIVQAIRTEIPNYLANAYEKAAGEEPYDEFNEDRYYRRKISSGYERFVSSNNPPFATCRETPYDWRLYDLRSNYNEDFDPKNNAVLIMDIHT